MVTVYVKFDIRHHSQLDPNTGEYPFLDHTKQTFLGKEWSVGYDPGWEVNPFGTWRFRNSDAGVPETVGVGREVRLHYYIAEYESYTYELPADFGNEPMLTTRLDTYGGNPGWDLAWKDYDWVAIELLSDPLFTEGGDRVNFNSLTPSQRDSVSSGADLFHALDGNDVVTLPDAMRIPGTSRTWGSGNFSAGQGHDRINGGKQPDGIDGGKGNDFLHGGGSHDALHGGDGNDTLNGGAGNDTFWGEAGNDTLDGGTKGTGGTEADRDIYHLEGRRSDWTFKDAEGGWTEITRDGGKEVDRVRDMELVRFEKNFAESNRTVNLLMESALAAEGAYKDKFLPGGTLWTPVHANEMGLGRRSDGADPSPIAWTFENGVYADKDGTAVAHVGQAMVNGHHTLMVAIRGTNTDSVGGLTKDAITGWGPQVDDFHWPAFDGLLRGIKTMLGETDIDRVVFAGHSLGGIIAQLFMDEFPDNYLGATYRAITFGSPGANSTATKDNRVLHVEHSQDIVATAGELGWLAGFHKSGERITVPVDDIATAWDNVPLNIGEHNMSLYAKHLRDLLEADPLPRVLTQTTFEAGRHTHMFAGTDKPDGFRGDIGAHDELLFGRGGSDTVEANGGDDIVYGGNGNDTLYGGRGDDVLRGGDGRDRLVGDGGLDHLFGGKDRDQDVFVFEDRFDSRPGPTRDVLHEFTRGIDRIDLRPLDARLDVGSNDVFAWSGRTAAAHSVWWEERGNGVVLRADVTGDNAADFAIYLKGVSALDRGDVWL
ncbi:M10 family metallopeptidase C-terminal domain-containing protein [Rubellimicrobium arenae]|uniref:M10 family metallopeptidase C-terminal domain-containing protein n=1 Tax=Rubellimicrobium arenae TaxID=2817372 RepID=UPI001B306794|nr:M10 family metallopeptidase C-terminal domain-containing protein [Rubellimicrobium arenae]